MLATLKGKQLYVTLWFNQRTVSLQIICIYVKYSVQLLCFHRRRTNAKNESERNNIEIFGKKQSPNTVVANATEMKVQQHAAQWKTWQLSFASLYLAVKMHGYYFTSMTLVVEYQFWARDHPYITSAKGLGGWDQKNGNFCWCSVLFMPRADLSFSKKLCKSYKGGCFGLLTHHLQLKYYVSKMGGQLWFVGS